MRSQAQDREGTAESRAEEEQRKPAEGQGRPRYSVPPTFSNVPYGTHERQVLDFFKADTKEPAPLVIHIHGGGWVNGDKVGVGDLKKLLDSGISVASINYRFTTQAQAAGIKPPVKWPLEDAARAVQFLRSKAGEWNIDKSRIAATGGSAGACSSLWLAFHDDMAKPDSTDPVARESTRLTAAAVNGAQTSLDPLQLREWIPNMRYGGHAFGFTGGRWPRLTVPAVLRPPRRRARLDQGILALCPRRPRRPAGLPLLSGPGQASGQGRRPDGPDAHRRPRPSSRREAQGRRRRGPLVYPGHKDPEYASITDFLIAKLKASKP